MSCHVPPSVLCSQCLNGERCQHLRQGEEGDEPVFACARERSGDPDRQEHICDRLIDSAPSRLPE